MFQFGAPPPMKTAGVATIDSPLKSIVGFQKPTNAQRDRGERSNRGYTKPQIHSMPLRSPSPRMKMGEGETPGEPPFTTPPG
jgi:hypothetical protein